MTQHQFKEGQIVVLARPFSSGDYHGITKSQYGNKFKIMCLRATHIEIQAVDMTGKVDHRHHWGVSAHMLDPDWPVVKGGERWRVQIGGQSYVRPFERGLSPPALASAALDMPESKFEFKSKNPSMLTGKLPNGDLFTLMRVE